MAFDRIDGALLREMILNGATLLESRKAQINQLNVFPVPDGDTGTNMSLTMGNACKEVRAVQELTCHNIADALARGALKGARGNSGVILSQLFRGFARGVAGLDVMDAKQFAAALKSGVETAYKAVMKPREGTILTVSRAFADAAERLAATQDDITLVLDGALSYGEEILQKTPDMLDVLKKAGVVDAGGEGLLVIYKGYQASLRGEGLISLPEGQEQAVPVAEDVRHLEDIGELEDITFGYCTEFLIEHLKRPMDPIAVTRLRGQLENVGDSVVLVSDEDILKVHIHTNNPDKVLSWALAIGEVNAIKIDNMREQFREVQARRDAARRNSPPKELAMITVAAGEGIKSIFRDIMVDGFVEGGQTMNPSAEDIAEAIRSVNATSVLVLPNNSNIILAARQASELVECDVHVVATKTIPQGIAAALAFNPEASAEENADNMVQAMTLVKSGTVTYSVRDSSADGFDIHEGDILGIGEKSIACVGAEIADVTMDLITRLMDEDSCMVSFYWGSDIKKEDAMALRDRVRAAWPNCDAEAYEGGQPIYYYIVSVE